MNKEQKQQYVEAYNFQFCSLETKYEKVAKIGQGTFGEVFKARNKRIPTQVVAMKKILMENETEGFPITAMREIRILQLLKHKNIVNLLEICRTKPTPANNFRSTFYLIFEFCEHDLAGLLANVKVKFNLAEIKHIMHQLLDGLYYIHVNKILHRDLKAANILITKAGVLKLADFGLARPFSKKSNGDANRYTNGVVTLWYRPPELLLGEKDYGPAIDMWSAGCLMAEMWTRCPIMRGNTEQQQLLLISQMCGSITPRVWPNVEKYNLYYKMDLPKHYKRIVNERLKPYIRDPSACDLLNRLLTLDPSKRIDADAALNHDFFWTDPMPSSLENVMKEYNQSMFEFLVAPQRAAQHQKQPRYEHRQLVDGAQHHHQHQQHHHHHARSHQPRDKIDRAVAHFQHQKEVC